MKALFIVNRRSGARRRRDITRIIRESCSWDYGIAESERKEDLDWIVSEAKKSGVDVVYAVGGDGTVHEVASASSAPLSPSASCRRDRATASRATSACR